MIYLPFWLLLCLHTLPVTYSWNEADDDWEKFKRNHDKHYSEKENDLRRKIWEENLEHIKQHNQEADEGVYSFYVGENRFSDLTEDELKYSMHGFLMQNETDEDEVFYSSNINASTLPASVDWREHGYVTKVKDQKNCGGCWAFATTGALEGQHFKKTKKLVSLSEQNLIDCSHGSHGCNGGLPQQGFAYVKKNKGIDTEKSYPYRGKDGKCHFKTKTVGAQASGFKKIPPMSELDLQKAVSEIGPITAGINAFHHKFHAYKHGIYSNDLCDQHDLDHAVLIVGYGSMKGKDYWIVKNSWGSTWGDKGYVLIARNKNNMCGVATCAAYPVL